MVLGQTKLITVDDDASPEVLETMEAAANIHVDDTITPRVGLSSDNYTHFSLILVVAPE